MMKNNDKASEKDTTKQNTKIKEITTKLKGKDNINTSKNKTKVVENTESKLSKGKVNFKTIRKIKKSHKNVETELTDLLVERLNISLEKNLQSQLRELFSNLHAVDQANYLTSLTYDPREQLIKAIPETIKPDTLIEVNEGLREEIVDIMGFEIAADLITKMDLKDAVEVLDELPDEFREGVLSAVKSSAMREGLEEGLAYPEYSVGRLILGNGFVAVPMTWNVKQVIGYIYSSRASLPKAFSSIILVDDEQHPHSEVLLSRILSSDPDSKLVDIMVNRDLIKTLTIDTDQAEVIAIFKKYRFNSISVVDQQGALMGVVSLEDVVDVVEEETEEDMMRMHGMDESDIHSSPAVSARTRFPWLFSSTITSTLASLIVGMFGDVIEREVAIAALLPIVANLSGSSGNQTVTVMVRAIATGQLQHTATLRVLWKEVLSTLLNSLVLACLIGGISYFRFHSFALAALPAVSLVFTMIFASIIGTVIPLFINSLKLDPAISSGVFLTASTDITAFSCVLLLAKFFLS